MKLIGRRELLQRAGMGTLALFLRALTQTSRMAFGAGSASSPPHLMPTSLRCEYLIEPLGIDVLQPRLRWALACTETGSRGLKQTAYQILVATGLPRLGANQGDLWDSGRVESDRSSQVQYSGRPLAARFHCWWKVRVWDQNGRPSPWSDPAQWSMGLLEPSDWAGPWISGPTDPNETAAAHLRRHIDLPDLPARTTAYICGLGYYELYINGHRVGDHVLDPAFTCYDKRVLYVTYDVTPLIRRGKNALGVVLGNGWYHPVTPDLFGFEKAPWREPPKFTLTLDVHHSDGSQQVITSDSSWVWYRGPITFNCIRGGVTYDARLEKPGWAERVYDDIRWRSASVVPPPKGRLRAQMEPPIRITDTVRPVKLTEPKSGVYVFDFGVNLTGWARLKAHGKPGQTIVLKSDLVLNSDGTVDMKYCHSHTYGRFQTDELILDQHGNGLLEPRFTYHGFRYVQVEGLNYRPEVTSLTACNVHTDWKPAGQFSCSDPMINRLQAAIRRTLSECAHSIPGEEPTREKMGWTQDGQNSMEAAVYNFHAAAVYTKYLFDMIDAQQSDGSVPPIVPTDGWGDTGRGGSPAAYSDPWWGDTLPYVALKLHEYYGDRRVIEEAYAPMRRWASYLSSTAKDHLIEWGLGDWNEVGSAGRPKRTPVVQTSTAGYYFCVMAVVHAARLLGKAEDAAKYGRLAESIRASFNEHFFDEHTGLYARDSQTSQVLPLWLNMVPTSKRRIVLSRLIENIHQHGDHMTTGFVGVMPMLHGLACWGYPDLAFKVAMQKDIPGFLWMVTRRNTTMGESVDGLDGTDLHPFGTCIGSFLFKEIAGIRPDASEVGFRKVVIRPVTGNLSWVNARYNSVAGPVSTAWKREPRSFILQVSIPPNATATVYLPVEAGEEVTESGRAIDKSKHVRLIRTDRRQSVLAISSGDYNFAVKR